MGNYTTLYLEARLKPKCAENLEFYHAMDQLLDLSAPDLPLALRPYHAFWLDERCYHVTGGSYDVYLKSFPHSGFPEIGSRLTGDILRLTFSVKNYTWVIEKLLDYLEPHIEYLVEGLWASDDYLDFSAAPVKFDLEKLQFYREMRQEVTNGWDGTETEVTKRVFAPPPVVTKPEWQAYQKAFAVLVATVESDLDEGDIKIVNGLGLADEGKSGTTVYSLVYQGRFVRHLTPAEIKSYKKFCNSTMTLIT